jgi:hypothetical protein
MKILIAILIVLMTFTAIGIYDLNQKFNCIYDSSVLSQFQTDLGRSSFEQLVYTSCK